MLQPDVYWIREVKGLKLAIMPRPRNGERLVDEIAGWRRMEIANVVSLLETEESRELGLSEEAALCRNAGVRFYSYPIPDRGVPQDHKGFAALVATLGGHLKAGDSVAVHCRAGIGRSGLLGACILGFFGIDAAEAFTMLSRARGVSVPDTDAQATWVLEFMRRYPERWEL
jgi:protein-tyrosine phosphatase